MKPVYRTTWILFFAIAMGYLESAVVVYLRELYYPGGFCFPLKAMPQYVALTELYREAATLIMILAVSILVAELWLHRFAWFLVVFSVWDIAYYVFLKLLLGWPESIFTTDILFLLPSIWTGPVIAPVMNSFTMLLIAWVILEKRKGLQPVVRLSRIVWLLLIAGSLIILIAYMKDFAAYTIEYKQSFPFAAHTQTQLMFDLSTRFIPRNFDWLLFCTGVVMHITALSLIYLRRRKEKVEV